MIYRADSIAFPSPRIHSPGLRCPPITQHSTLHRTHPKQALLLYSSLPFYLDEVTWIVFPLILLKRFYDQVTVTLQIFETAMVRLLNLLV